MIVPIVCAAIGLWALLSGVTLSDSFARGGLEGLRTLPRIFTALLFLLPMLSVMRVSGLLDWLTGLLAPLTEALGIPKELAPILLLRPFSGSGALAAATDIMMTYGPDSAIGRTAAVMLGSTETTFYVLTVYFAGLERKPPKGILPAALTADAVGFVAAAAWVRMGL